MVDERWCHLGGFRFRPGDMNQIYARQPAGVLPWAGNSIYIEPAPWGWISDGRGRFYIRLLPGTKKIRIWVGPHGPITMRFPHETQKPVVEVEKILE